MSTFTQFEPACFVRDSVNDVQALSGLSVGNAVGAGAHIAAEVASLIMVRPNLWIVLDAIDLARATSRSVRFKVYCAIGYNLVIIVMSAGIRYPSRQLRVPPMVAGMVMAHSSTCVVFRS